MRNISYELFDNHDSMELNSRNVRFNKREIEGLIKKIDTEMMHNIAVNANEALNGETNDECVIRTDTKYLNYIKKIEMYMFIESKRRIKSRRYTASRSEEKFDTPEIENINSLHGNNRDTSRESVSFLRRKREIPNGDAHNVAHNDDHTRNDQIHTPYKGSNNRDELNDEKKDNHFCSTSPKKLKESASV